MYNKIHPIKFTLIFYSTCFAFRFIEYFFIRTDQSIIGEAFIHKIIGIILLILAAKLLHYKLSDIGFYVNKFIPDTLLGLLLGVTVFTIAYGTELLIQSSSNNAPVLKFYVTSYSILGNAAMQSSFISLFICIVGNIINVVMEEGVFRGLFSTLMEERYTFLKACIFSSILFGIWHIAQPLRNLIDGQQSIMGAMMSSLLLVVTSTLLGIQYCMLFKITGSLWASMSAHFINNSAINLLHIVTSSGVDELQTIRIAIAQTLSFIVVLIFFLFYSKNKKIKNR